jgi:dihydrofolate reductase
MRKIIVTAFVSLDGVMQGPGSPKEDTSGGFSFGGWTVPLWDETTGAINMEIYGRPYDLLLGRKTYDVFAAYWPRITDPSHPIGSAFNRVTKYVASRARPKLEWHNSQLLGEDVVASLRKLKSQDGPALLVPGSSDLLQTLWKNSLVDELNVLIFPLALGQGKRLFGDGTIPAGFKPVKSMTSSTGVIEAYYVLDGAVKTGSWPEPS